MLEARITLLAERFRLPAEVRAALLDAVREAERPQPTDEITQVREIKPRGPGGRQDPAIDDEPTQFLPNPTPVVQQRKKPASPRVIAPPPPQAPPPPPARVGPTPAKTTPAAAAKVHQAEISALDEPTQFLAAVMPKAPPKTMRDPADRYEDLGLIGTGATAEVRRVKDAELNRVMAMKVLHPHLLSASGVVARFVSEAQATAQLEHPGIIPVHAMGKLPDGRYYFTMKEVRGVTLGSVIADVHGAVKQGRWETAANGWTFRRLIEAFRKVCEAVAYAHARGVVHRDLKPENIMVGAFGEVVVMDWGLAKIVGAPEPAPDGQDVVSTSRSRDSAFATRMGSIAGTPTYMPPEQARGAHNEIVPASDVYALGAILYEILSGHPPYQGNDAISVLAQVLDGPPPPPGRVAQSGPPHATMTGEEDGPPPIPEELSQICLKAIARMARDRYVNAGEMASEIEAWLDGAKKREQARIELDQAGALWEEVQQLRVQATEVREQARQLLQNVRPNEPVERKRPAWSLEERASRLEAKADLKEVVMTQVLQAALTFVPDYTEAHDLLASHYRTLHTEAELRRDRSSAVRYEVLLQAHDTGVHTGYLKGDGALTLVTDPPDAEVELCRYALFDRRLRTVPVRVLGRTPLREVELQRGSYLLKIRAPGRAEVRYPIFIGRQEHWDGVAPGGKEPFPVYLPTATELGPNGLYVPAGWFWCGGDGEAPDALPRQRVWVDGFAMLRFPVTNYEYIAYLDALVRAGKEQDALRKAPRERGGTVGRQGALIYGRDAEGRFILRQDADGDKWEPTWPVVMVDHAGAEGYARWHTARTRQPWRLPLSLEWEKAARGVDGRFYPWGDYLDPTWCCMADSHSRRPTLAPVDAYPTDESPYGVHGLAGNTRDWCLDPHAEGGPLILHHKAALPNANKPDTTTPRYVRGGCWSGNAHAARAAAQLWLDPDRRGSEVGLRLVRPLGNPPSVTPGE